MGFTDPRYKTPSLLELDQPLTFKTNTSCSWGQVWQASKGKRSLSQSSARLAIGFTLVILKPLLFGSYLAHVDPHTDDFPCLHANGARGLPVPSRGRVEGRHWSVLDALAPGTGLPVVHGAGMLVTATHLLQSTAVWTVSSTYRNEQQKRISYSADRKLTILSSSKLRVTMIPVIC